MGPIHGNILSVFTSVDSFTNRTHALIKKKKERKKTCGGHLCNFKKTLGEIPPTKKQSH